MPTALDIIQTLLANVNALKAHNAGLIEENGSLKVKNSDLSTREANVTSQLADLSDAVSGYVTGLGLQPHAPAAAPAEHVDAGPVQPAAAASADSAPLQPDALPPGFIDPAAGRLAQIAPQLPGNTVLTGSGIVELMAAAAADPVAPPLAAAPSGVPGWMTVSDHGAAQAVPGIAGVG